MEYLSLLQLRISPGKRRTKDRENSLSRSKEEMTEIYQRHADTVYRVCFSLMGNSLDAEDATQGVFLKLMNARIRFTSTEHEKAWLIKTAQNQCRDIHRQWWRKKVSTLDKTDVEVAVDPTEASAVTQSLLQLPPDQRLLLYLYYYEGYQLLEISNMLDRNLNTVKSQIRAAKRRLKIELGDEQND